MTPDILPYAILTGTAVVLGVWAAVGWMRAETRIAALEAELSDADSEIARLHAHIAGEPARTARTSRALDLAKSCIESMGSAFIDAERRLREIKRQRSETTRKGNITRAAKRKALVDARKAELDRWNADRIAA